MKRYLILRILLGISIQFAYGQLVTNGLISNYNFTKGSKVDSLTGISLLGSIPFPTSDRCGIDSNAFYFPAGSAAYFDAGDSYDSLISGDTAKFSLSLWFWLENDAVNTNRILLSKRADNNCNQDQRQFYISINQSNQIQTVVAGTLAQNNYLWEVDSSTIISDSIWYHIIYNYDFQQNQRRLFINCKEDSLRKFILKGNGMNNGIVPGAAHFGIGASLTTAGLLCFGPSITGKIDDIRIYDHVLNQNERDSLCNECLNATSFASSDSSFCEKQCIDFYDLSQNNPTSWQWNFTGASPSSSTDKNPSGICYNNYGSFDVSLVACNSAGCDSVFYPNFITEFQSPTDSIWESNGQLFSILAFMYQWYEVNAGLIPGATNWNYQPTQAGNYYCIITDTNGCNGVSNTIYSTDINQVDKIAGISIYPNPFSDEITVELTNKNGKNTTLTIKNIMCQVVFRDDDIYNLKNKKIIDVSDLPTGIYFFQLETVKGIFTKKFIKH